MRFPAARQLPLIVAAAAVMWGLPARAQITESLPREEPASSARRESSREGSGTLPGFPTISAAAVVAPKRMPLLGAMMDAGLPDGANAALVFRPFSWLRAHGGGGTNMVSKGVRAGVTLLPFGSGPSATLEAGHYFDGDANGLARRFAGSTFSSPLLERVGYDYANAHLGLDFGSRRVVFYIHGGMSYVRATIHNFDSVVASEASANGANGSTEVAVKSDPVVRAWVPSAKLGLIVYLW